MFFLPFLDLMPWWPGRALAERAQLSSFSPGLLHAHLQEGSLAKHRWLNMCELQGFVFVFILFFVSFNIAILWWTFRGSKKYVPGNRATPLQSPCSKVWIFYTISVKWLHKLLSWRKQCIFFLFLLKWKRNPLEVEIWHAKFTEWLKFGKLFCKEVKVS